MLVFTNNQLATFNKGQLREACREKGIGYAGMNNDGMRAALAEYASDFGTVVDANVGSEARELVSLRDTNPTVAEVAAQKPRVLPTLVAPTTLEPVAPVAPVAKAPKEPKVPQPEANGVKRPKAGTICAQIWDWCDKTNTEGVRPEAKALRAALVGLDDTTKTVQFYRWRKFNGIQGR